MNYQGPCIISLLNNTGLQFDAGSPSTGRSPLLASAGYHFPFVDLDAGVQDMSSPEYAYMSPFMRAGKILTYVGRSQRTVSMVIHIMPDNGPNASNQKTVPLTDVNGIESTIAGVLQSSATSVYNTVTGQSAPAEDNRNTVWVNVVRPAQWLAALKDPYVGTDGFMHAPPRVQVSIGANDGPISMMAVVVQCSVIWKGPWYASDSATSDGVSLNGLDVLPGQADVAIVFSEVN